MAGGNGVKLGSVNSPASRSLFGSFSFGSSLLKTIGVGALAGLAGSLLNEPLYAALDRRTSNILAELASGSVTVALIAVVLGGALLAWDNASSLRGKWHRDLAPGLPLFAFIGLVAGGAAGVIYAVGLRALGVNEEALSLGQALPSLMLVRGLAWALFGAGVGASIGLLRGDRGQTLRGVLGGAIGGFAGGALFDPIALLIHETGTGTTSRAIGFLLLGAFLGAAYRLVGEVLKSAWLLGISTGPYEGKEYPLGKARVSVGRASNCDLSLFRDETLAPQVGAFVFQNNSWFWQGEAITINGVPQTNAQLLPGARLQIGGTLFRFNDRSKTAPRDPLAPVQFPISTQAPVASSSSAPVTPVPVAAAPLAWTFSPSIGNTLTGFRLSVENASATVGRAPDNDWQLSDDGTSSRHAKLERTFEGLALTDLGSTNGTFINGQKMAPNIAVALGGGETIRFGRTSWMVRRGA